jgi:hypothetical protein
MTTALILSRLSRSFDRLFDHDGELFERGKGGVHEQTLTFRLAIYLQQEFPAYSVDCEYNRRGADSKKRSSAGGLIKPDVVVHQRGVAGPNLLAIEAKKSIHWQAEWDGLSEKVSDLTNPAGLFGYTLGMCWKLEPSRTRADHRAFWYSHGTFVLETSLHPFQSAVFAKLKELGHVR